MSLLNVVPDSVTAAAGNLQDIGSAVRTATAAAAAQTTAIAAPAADEVSTAITALFGASAQGFQTVSAKAAAFHDEFANLLNGGAAQYVHTEIANAEQMLVNTLNTPAVAPLGHPLIGTGQWTASAASPAGFWSNLAGSFAGSDIGKSIYNAVVTAETRLAISGETAAVGALIGGAIGTFLEPGGGTVIGAEVGSEVAVEATALWEGSAAILEEAYAGFAEVPTLSENLSAIGGLLGGLAPGFVVGNAFNYVTGAGQFIGNAIADFPSNISYLINNINYLFPTQSLSSLSQLSNWGLGPSIAITSDVVGPWGADGIQQDVTGVFDFGAGPFSVQVGSFSGMSAADMYGGMASVNATAFGIRESGSVYSSNGGAPQFSFSVDVPAVTGLLQDFATYLP